MKKTIVIVLLVVYIASIAVVNFFGLEIKIFDGITYVQEIKCNSVTVQNENPVTLEPKQMLGGKPLFIFEFIPADENNPYTTDDESIINNPNAVQINYEVFPHLANETGLVVKTISRALKKLEEEGLITKSERFVLINHEQYLRMKEYVDGLIYLSEEK